MKKKKRSQSNNIAILQWFVTVLSGKKGFLKLVCNFAMICDTLWAGQKRVICPALHKGPFHCRRIRPTIFDPWREVQPSGERWEERGASWNIRGGEMQLREKTSLWSFQSVEANPALTGVQVRKLPLSTSTSCHSPPSLRTPEPELHFSRNLETVPK